MFPEVSANLTLGEAAAAIGVSADTLRRWDRAGKLTTSATSVTAAWSPPRRSAASPTGPSAMRPAAGCRRATG